MLETVSNDTTIVMNCFTWKSFCENGFFDINKTPSEVGLVSEIFRRIDGVVRSPHPIYSMCAYGPKAKELMVHEGTTCWGDNTPFEKLVSNNCYLLTIGDDLNKGLTLFHRFEEMKKVPYRFYKTFTGIVDFGNGKKEYSTKFFVRKDRQLKHNWKPAIDILEKKGAINHIDNPFPIWCVHAKDLEKTCYNLLDRDIEVFILKKK